MEFSNLTNGENIPHIYFTHFFSDDQNISPDKVLDIQETVTYESSKDTYSFQLAL